LKLQQQADKETDMSDNLPDFKMDSQALYLEEQFTDHKVGSIRRMTPVDGDGKHDATRKTEYWGQTQVMTQVGALPLSFELEADSLEQAAEGFAEAAKQALEKTMDELQEMRRQQQSQIVTPDSGGGGMGGMGGGPGGGGMPGSGFQMP
jgi:hypothetical protein